MRKTQFFGPEVRPVHEGVYEIFMDSTKGIPDRFAYWDGRVWGLTSGNVDTAYPKIQGHDCYSKHFIGWRGLANKPKEGK